ncbi:unnamed protein product [Coregonus sp. 'balchen']|nr:unnamed protein product [Coregonus sp. 'balchen']
MSKGCLLWVGSINCIYARAHASAPAPCPCAQLESLWSWMAASAARCVPGSRGRPAVICTCVIASEDCSVTTAPASPATLESVPVFQPSCATQCRCLGGGVTCVPLCPEDVRLPSPDCPHPQRVQLPGKCCKEWVCENMDNTIIQDAITASRSDRLWPDLSGPQQNPTFNCIDQSTEWSVCSRTCGVGVSTRVSNKNPACRLEMQSRLCKVRPCQALQPRRSPMWGRRCEPSYRSVVPVRLVHQGCYSKRVYRPRYCGQCTDARCCTPYRTSTATVAFRCPTGRVLYRAVMMIQSCVCHYNCPYSASGPYADVPYSGPSRSYRIPAMWG